MSDIRSIIKNNNGTFYNFRTGDPVNTWPRLGIFIVLSIFLGVLLSGNLKDFLNGVITVNSILIAFSFTVMFFLVSKDQVKEINTAVIEDKLLARRLKTLSKELFHNVAYFNMIAIGCTIIAVTLMVPYESALVENVLNYCPTVVSGVVTAIWQPVGQTMVVFARIVFFFGLIESAYTFWRTTGRIIYLFDERIQSEPS